MSRNCQPIVFRDDEGTLWAYYMKRRCFQCGYPTAQLIDPTGFYLKCGECRVITSVEKGYQLCCESCSTPMPWLTDCRAAWVKLEMGVDSLWACAYCIEEEAA